MASENMDSLRQESWPPVNPWHLALAGLAASLAALFVYYLQTQWPGDGPERVLVPVRCLAITAAVILAGGAVSVRLRKATWEFEERVVSASLTGVAAFTVLLGWLALDREAWFSMALFLGVLSFVGFAACVLILLPRNARRVVAVVLVILHFCGILSAVTSAPQPGTEPPWMTQVVWTYFSRPYLQFMYLNNAYHFYSPEPGPATHLWFYIKFEDGSGEWLKVPKREDYVTRQEYQRILSVTENSRQLIEVQQMPPEVLKNIEFAYQARLREGRNYDPPIKTAPWDEPSNQGTPPIRQFQLPNVIAQKMIKSYAKHVAQTYHSAERPNEKVKSVKVYRVFHSIPSPQQMSLGILQPDDPTTFLPYYQGEFYPDGEMVNPSDPFKYWIIPIMYELKKDHRPTPGRENTPPASNDDYEIVDYCKLHAEGHSR
jgi:hypothetical protein